MNEETLEILQTNALQLLGIQLEGYGMDDLKGISNHIKSPFTNTSRKQFKDELKHFIVNMGSNKIYHYTNVFDVNFLIFKFKKYKQIYIIGPTWNSDLMNDVVMNCYNKRILKYLNCLY
ncbi:hypothetical protein [Staphylococcus saprophyticus]|uniref:hypothetical protein n=1 Tax=Staphylococcus saprophyticus TaxID=29385 RepID=UPI002108C82B|nr:hypothetical protein [Staphylococcus saprophyticus]WMM14959.1 hypothetical protein RCG45_09475 [Staphylococcus saprophyticus]